MGILLRRHEREMWVLLMLLRDIIADRRMDEVTFPYEYKLPLLPALVQRINTHCSYCKKSNLKLYIHTYTQLSILEKVVPAVALTLSHFKLCYQVQQVIWHVLAVSRGWQQIRQTDTTPIRMCSLPMNRDFCVAH